MGLYSHIKIQNVHKKLILKKNRQLQKNFKMNWFDAFFADRLRDTLLHEMCHAAAWIKSGVRDGHGPFWKGWSQKAMKAFPDLPVIGKYLIIMFH